MTPMLMGTEQVVLVTGGLLVTSMSVARRRRKAGLVVAPCLVAALLTACGGGDGSGVLPSPTGSVTASVLPSRTASVPSPTRSPSRGESEEPTASTTVTVTEPAISDSAAPTEAATETATETATEAESSGSGSGSGSSLPSWVWILVAAGALAAVLALILGRSRRRSSWSDDVTTARAEATWFARELLPQLQRSASSDEVAGGWKVATHRVTTLEDRLTGLQASAPDEASGARARQLRDAVRDARHAVDDLVQVGDLTTQVRGLSLTSARLDAALAPPASG